MNQVLAKPLRLLPEFENYKRPAKPDEIVSVTYCGTLMLNLKSFNTLSIKPVECYPKLFDYVGTKKSVMKGKKS